jgi:hypothetical protein
MEKITIHTHPDVELKFESYPKEIKPKINHFRGELIPLPLFEFCKY